MDHIPWVGIVSLVITIAIIAWEVRRCWRDQHCPKCGNNRAGFVNRPYQSDGRWCTKCYHQWVP
jgi:hypothetical protein